MTTPDAVAAQRSAPEPGASRPAFPGPGRSRRGASGSSGPPRGRKRPRLIRPGPPPDPKPDGDPRRFFLVLLFWGTGVWATLLVGWFLAKAVFAWTGRPGPLGAYLTASALGLAIAIGIMVTVFLCLVRGQGDQWRRGDPILEALRRIGGGDFDVRIDPPQGPFNEVVESVNAMARSLGTLEQQRQDFISNVSHEIQSPLTSIKGFAELLREPGLDQETRDHYLGIIAAECRRLSQLGANLLRLSALDNAELDRRPFRLDNQLREVILMLEPQWSAAGVAVELDAPAGAEATGDVDLLRQVWVNLAHNAIKFTPQGGSVAVRVAPGRASAAGDAGWLVEVRDSGHGIGREDLPHIFERFYRADKARAVGGNGLGLALAKRIVDLHGGEIAVASALGEGSTFTVRLPS
ncbi:MAG: HAMP domain-containing histidine kinase [Bifidobacteriaceae bacterium]|nr:HAMP domain-containing histidine kinase [Bifidobacteriaceae bacterium]